MLSKLTPYAAVFLLAVTLTGCSAHGGEATSSALAPVVASDEPATAPAPTATTGDTNGDGKLSEREKEILTKNAPRAFTLTDGTVVSIDPQGPLPAEVVATLKQRMAPLGADVAAATTETTWKVLDLIKTEADHVAASVGRGIVFTFQCESSYDFESVTVWAASSSGNQDGAVQANPDGDAFNAEVQAWAASRDYEVIHIQ